MKVDAIVKSPHRSIPEISRGLETIGVDGLWSAESNQDPFFALALSGEHTGKVSLGTSVAVALARSPMSLAYEIAAVEALAPGRVIVGLGSQLRAHVSRRFNMQWTNPVARMREYVLALKSIWATWTLNDRLNFRGKYYSHTYMPPFFTPEIAPDSPLPVFLAGVGVEMTRTAGEVADGYLAHPLSTKKYLETVSLPALKTGKGARVRGQGDVTVAALGLVITGTDEEMATAYSAVRQQIALYASVAAYRPVLALHSLEDLHDELRRLILRSRWDQVSDVVTDDVIDLFAIMATPDELPQAIRTRFDGSVDRFIFSLPNSALASPDAWSERIAAARGSQPRLDETLRTI
jgi:probable F420-dependent oxidoreductase